MGKDDVHISELPSTDDILTTEPRVVDVHRYDSSILTSTASTSFIPSFSDFPTLSAMSAAIRSVPAGINYLTRLQITQSKLESEYAKMKRQSRMEGRLLALGADFRPQEAINPAKLIEPRVSPQRNVLIWSCVGSNGVSRLLRCLADSGAELDMMDSKVARSLGLEVQPLTSPLNLFLGTVGRSDRLSSFVTADFVSGQIQLEKHPFFVGNVQGYDVILGLPFIEVTDLLVGSGRVQRSKVSSPLSVSSSHSSLPVFSDETSRAMTTDETARFNMIEGMVDGDEFIADEDHNPLADVVDDPSVPDYSAEEARVLADALLVEFDDVLCDDLPDCLPPFRSVNHEIVLIDPALKNRPRSYPMPNRFTTQWLAHRQLYVSSGRWSPAALDSACAMFAIPKKDPAEARFVINLKPRNANTVKMHTPIPDMRSVRADVASRPFRSQVDFKSAFEQIRICPKDVSKSGFTTPTGTFQSSVMQMGDCNAPDTMNRVVYLMFQKHLGYFLAVFFDDAHIFSWTRRSHLRHLRIVFSTLRHYKFYLGRSKVNLFAESMMSLGSIISDNGIEVDPKKWDRIRDWPVPRDAKDCLRFMGTVNWMSDHLDGIARIMAPISALTGKAEFVWGESQTKAFETIKSMVPAALIPIDWAKVGTGEHKLFVTGDASITGLGSVLSSGPSRLEARPYRFHSAKFNSAQRNYDTTNQELLAIVEGCKAFQQHLIGYPFVVVTDHRALETYVSTLPTLTRRHVRMATELSRFDFSIEFLDGKSNVIADSLSRLYETDMEATPADYVHEPDLDELFPDSAAMMKSAEFLLLSSRFALNSAEVVHQIRNAYQSADSDSLKEVADFRLKQDSRNRFDSSFPVLESSVFRPSNGGLEVAQVSAHCAPVRGRRRVAVEKEVVDDRDPLDLLGPLNTFPDESPLLLHSETLSQLPDEFTGALFDAYRNDPKYSEILSNLSSWPSFEVAEDTFIYYIDPDGTRRLCVPRGKLLGDGGRVATLREFVLDVAHDRLAHAGSAITLSFLRRFFWWDKLTKDTEDFCRSCESCARSKSSTGKPFGLLHPMPIPSRPWEATAMDFITGLPAVLLNFEMVDSILVVTDVFSKTVHLIPLSSAATAIDVARAYHNNIYRLHGMQRSVTSDRDPKFTGHFWRALQEKVGTKMKMSTAAHPETDGASENRVKTVSTAIRCLAADDPDSWASRLTDVEFAINSSTAGATGMSPFELTQGFLPPPFPFATWSASDVPGAEAFAESIRLNWIKAGDAIIGARLDMAVQANKHRRIDSPLFAVGNRVYVDTLHLSFPAYTTRKLLPRFMGPYLITAAVPATSNYDIDFPAHFAVHRRFHASKLRPHFPNDAERFPARNFLVPSLLEATDAAAGSWIIEKIILDRSERGLRKYLVSFLGYSQSENIYLTETALISKDRAMWVAYVARKGGNLAKPGIKKIRRVK